MSTRTVLTLGWTDDIENQQAVRLAKEADPTGERTIGMRNNFGGLF
jgi:hypothetical protein